MPKRKRQGPYWASLGRPVLHLSRFRSNKVEKLLEPGQGTSAVDETE